MSLSINIDFFFPPKFLPAQRPFNKQHHRNLSDDLMRSHTWTLTWTCCLSSCLKLSLEELITAILNCCVWIINSRAAFRTILSLLQCSADTESYGKNAPGHLAKKVELLWGTWRNIIQQDAIKQLHININDVILSIYLVLDSKVYKVMPLW